MSDKNQRKRKGTKQRVLSSIVIILLIISIVALLYSILNAGGHAAFSTYTENVEEKRRETSERIYQMSYELAEKSHHVSNNTMIEIQKITEESLLEVLQVSDVEYIYDINDTRLWTVVFGTGAYTVDLKGGEFLVDQERQYVLIRIPGPQFDHAQIKYENATYEFKDGFFDRSISEGMDDARNDLKEAQKKLKEKMRSSQLYLSSAEESARNVITSLVKNLNPDSPDLTVEIEFMY